MEIFFHMLHITGKSGLRLGDYNLKFPQLRIPYHTFKFRPRVKEPALIIIRIYSGNLIIMLQGIISQQKPLILNAGAVISPAELIFILFGQPKI